MTIDIDNKTQWRIIEKSPDFTKYKKYTKPKLEYEGTLFCNNRKIGTCNAQLFDEYLILNNLRIRKNHRHNGYATHIIKYYIGIAYGHSVIPSLYISRIYPKTQWYNEKGLTSKKLLKFYQKFGFDIDKEYGKWLPKKYFLTIKH